MHFWDKFTYWLGCYNEDEILGQLQPYQISQESEHRHGYQPVECMPQRPAPVAYAGMLPEGKRTITDLETVKTIIYDSSPDDLARSQIEVQKGKLGSRWVVYEELDEDGKAAVDKYHKRPRNGNNRGRDGDVFGVSCMRSQCVTR